MNAIAALKSFLAEAVERFGTPAYALPGRISLPVDDPHDTLPATHPREHDRAEGQSFAIDYVDHAGHPSHRRISVWAVERNPEGIPILVARCHERQAARAFRVDRITGVTDFDGTRREPLVRFFFETFGFLWPDDAPLAPPPPEDARWDRIRDISRRSGVAVLCALAHADHAVRAAEVDEMRLYCEAACAAAGLDLTGAESERLAAWLGRLRPTVESVDAALDALLEGERETIAAVLRAGLRVVGADGHLHPREAEALDRFCLALTGRRLG